MHSEEQTELLTGHLLAVAVWPASTEEVDNLASAVRLLAATQNVAVEIVPVVLAAAQAVAELFLAVVLAAA